MANITLLSFFVLFQPVLWLSERYPRRPAIGKGARDREVTFPPDTWERFDGKQYSGPARISVSVPYDDLGYLEKIN
jgi:hypothetical protein